MSVEAVNPPNDTPTVDVPGARPVATERLVESRKSTLAVSDELHVAALLTSCTMLPRYVALAVKRTVVFLTADGVSGVIANDSGAPRVMLRLTFPAQQNELSG